MAIKIKSAALLSCALAAALATQGCPELYFEEARKDAGGVNRGMNMTLRDSGDEEKRRLETEERNKNLSEEEQARRQNERNEAAREMQERERADQERERAEKARFAEKTRAEEERLKEQAKRDREEFQRANAEREQRTLATRAVSSGVRNDGAVRASYVGQTEFGNGIDRSELTLD
jgi:hypothetical protein